MRLNFDEFKRSTHMSKFSFGMVFSAALLNHDQE